MKFTLVAVVLALCLVQSEAWWNMGYGMGMGMYGMYGMGMMGGMGMYGGMWGKRSAGEMPMMDEITKQTIRRTECAFTKDNEMLSCKGPTGVVECEVEVKLPAWKTDFKLFGISQVSETPATYELVPRKLDNSAWEWMMVAGKKVTLSLFSSEKKEAGLRVEENVCFEKMVELLKTSVRNEKVFIGSEQKYILGDLLVADKMPKISEGKLKRWYGMGYGMGYGYGMGGMGMGFGYGGYYGKRTGMPALTEVDLAKIMKETREKSKMV